MPSFPIKPALAGLLLSLATGLAAAQGPAVAPVVTPPALETPPPREQHLGFNEFGVAGSRALRGVKSTMDLPIGMRLDEVVVEAKLNLVYSYSPSLIEHLSHLNVVLNDQVVTSIPLLRDGAGSEQSREIALDPRFFTDYNHLRLEFIGHYTMECEDTLHSSLWATISERSAVHLKLAPLALAPNLALLPAPFFDRRDGRPLDLPLLLPPAADDDTLAAAGIVSSWFGAQAAYRGATFPIAGPALPDRKAVLFATDDALPPGLGLTPAEGPALAVVSPPANPHVVYLVVQGRNGADLKVAAQALALGQAVLSGTRAKVGTVNLGPDRVAYDAPNWVPSHRPVKFAELVDDAGALNIIGHQPDPIRINLRLPPDLMTWNKPGVPVDLKYRYTPPATDDNSTLTFTLNEQLVRAFRLKADTAPTERLQLVVPLLGDSFAPTIDRFVIPAFQLGVDNQMQFRFVLDYHKAGLCTDTTESAVRAAIDPDSTIDLTRFPHYVRMPDLSLFANAGWPFTKFADLAQTAIVLPDQPTANELGAAFEVLGRIGRHTGAAATRLTVVREKDIDQVADRDLLLIGGGRPEGLLARWAGQSALRVDGDQRAIDALSPTAAIPKELLYGRQRDAAGSAVDLRSDGPIAGLLAFESPLKGGRSVVALLASSDESRGRLARVLSDPDTVSQIRGDTVIVRGDALSSYTSQRGYFIGHLPWLTQLRLWLAEHPWAIVLLGLIAGLLLALWLFTRLRNAAIRRLDG